MNSTLGYGLFDCDNHMYEQKDSFTRYIEPRFRDRAVTHGDGVTTKAAVGTKPIAATDSPQTPEGVAVRPGSIKDLLKAMKSGDGEAVYAYGPMLRAYQYREDRIRLMDEQGVEACLLFPSTAVTVEAFIDDTDVLYANFSSFNRWLAEEWGFGAKGRIYAPPWISLRDRDRAVAEVEWALAQGARIVQMRTGPAYGRSPADAYFDPVWSRLNEASVAVAFHLTECGYNKNVSTWWGEDGSAQFWLQSAWQWTNLYCDRAIMDTLSALVFHNLFGRFPNLRVISVEHGAEWWPYLVSRMDKMRAMARNGPWPGGRLRERPSEIVKRHVFVTPFPEDDIAGIAERAGCGSLCLGSDFPHAEGCEKPIDYLEKLAGLADSEVRKIMRDNGRRVLGLPV
jgi:predicted TIM-barrel fold metal-dependent hydrolase